MSRYIDAEALKKKAIRYTDYHYKVNIEDIDNMPTADVQEVKNAKWLPYRFGLEVVACSNCRAVYEGGDSFRFCPKCGAKMDLED